MRFGYFTLSDNHYDNNQRAPNAFVADIVAEAIEADRLGIPLGVDRGAPFQHPGRAVLSGLGVGLCGGADSADLAGRQQ